MRVFFSGSRRRLAQDVHQQFAKAARALGREFASRGHTALLHSQGDDTIDSHLVAGLRDWAADSDSSPCVELHRSLGSKSIYTDRSLLDFQDVVYPRARESRDKRLEARVGAVAGSDAVLLMGGDKGTQRVQHIASSLRVPIVPVPRFGGAAETVFDRLEASFLDKPAINTRFQTVLEPLQDTDAAIATVDLCEILSARRVYFISYPHELRPVADHIEALLWRSSAVVVRDEHEVELSDHLKTVLGRAIRTADTVLVVWSAETHASEWCRWELGTALRSKVDTGRPRRVVLLRSDDTELPEPLSGTLQLGGQNRGSRETSINRLVSSERDAY